MSRWTRRATAYGWPLLLIGGFALACGGSKEQAPHPSGAAMAPAPRAADVAGANRAPVIESVALSPKTPTPQSEIRAVVDVRDPDGDPVRLHYRWLLNGREIASSERPVVFVNEIAKGDQLEVEVSATDGHLDARPMTAQASMGNRPPVLSAVALDPFGDVRAGEVLSATPMVRDPDGDELSFEYTWQVNGKVRGHKRSFDTRGLKRGDQVQASVVADDGTVRTESVASPILQLRNTPPVIVQLPVVQTESGTFRYGFEAHDADGDRNLRFFLAKGPPGMRMDPMSGELSWTPTVSQAGVHDVEVGVKDGAGEGTTFAFQVTVTPHPGSAPPPASPGRE